MDSTRNLGEAHTSQFQSKNSKSSSLSRAAGGGVDKKKARIASQDVSQQSAANA